MCNYQTVKQQRELRSEILRSALERLKKQNPSFSLRALALKMKVSAAFLSRILNGKADLPFERVDELVRHLKLDRISENRLLRTFSDEKNRKLAEIGLPVGDADDSDALKDFIEISENRFFLLSRWYFVAILDLAGCRGFHDDPTWIAQRLRISQHEATSALHLLKSHGFLLQDERGRWVKSGRKMRFPTKESRELIRNYHALMMKKALKHLGEKTSQQAFERRLISGISCSVNPAQIPKAIDILNQALYKAAEILAEGPCDQVYHIGLQLFPVTQLESETPEQES